MSTYTLDDLRNIEQAIATGELSIERNGTRVTYRSIDELERAKRLITAELSAAGVLARQVGPRTVYAQFERD